MTKEEFNLSKEQKEALEKAKILKMLEKGENENGIPIENIHKVIAYLKDPLNEVFVENHHTNVYKKKIKDLQKTCSPKKLMKENKKLKEEVKKKDKRIKDLKSVLKDYTEGYEHLNEGIRRLLKYGGYRK